VRKKMQVVINISEKDYQTLKKKEEFDAMYLNYYEKLIVYGTPLPKGHGALIDISNIDVIELEDSIHFIRHEKGDDVDVYIGAPIIIEANKSEIPTGSTTKNDLGVDCISRQELLKIYEDRFFELQKMKHLKDNKGAEDRQMGINYCINILKELPPVTPIRPKGHWKLAQRGKSIDVCCSNCEAVRVKEFAYNYTIDQLDKEDVKKCLESDDMRYCPNCGAEMENEVEE
jgi:hypothetical protein